MFDVEKSDYVYSRFSDVSVAVLDHVAYPIDSLNQSSIPKLVKRTTHTRKEGPTPNLIAHAIYKTGESFRDPNQKEA